ncbi:MAG: hypothetical protein KatS3mg015_1867 [Fimbriimonadales bacterium]|nr:MAG: hypothetical protein KatS3mg015_1867 [Fimbriimonadales bacterium]
MRTIAGVLAFALAVAGCSFKRTTPTSSGHVVDRGDIEITVIETGKIEAVQDVEVKSRVSGRIAKLYVQEGDRVEKGQLIAEIDPQEIRLQLEQTTAQLRSAEAGAKRSLESVQLTRKQMETALQQAEARYIQAKREYENQPALTDASLRQAKINLEQAQRDLELLKNTTHPQQRVQAEADLQRTKAAAETDKANYERLVGLLQKGYVAQRDVDNARAQMEASQAAYRTAQENYDRLASRQAIELRNAEQAVAAAQAAYDQAKARANLDKNKEQAYLDAKAAFEQAKEDLRRINDGGSVACSGPRPSGSDPECCGRRSAATLRNQDRGAHVRGDHPKVSGGRRAGRGVEQLLRGHADRADRSAGRASSNAQHQRN